MMAFTPLIPQHFQFATGLKEISLDIRRLVLRWAKDNPTTDAAIAALRDIRDRLSPLTRKYVPSLAEPTA
jgi:hypothetical protein